MVAGPRGVYICNECVDLCNDIFSQLEPQPPDTFRWADLVDQQPALGSVAAGRLLKPGVLLVGTTRRDSSARIYRDCCPPERRRYHFVGLVRGDPHPAG
jgi:hypothetical protein